MDGRVKSFGLYCKRYWQRWLFDAGLARDLVIALVLALLVLLYQVRYGLVPTLQARAASWSLLYPYLWVLVIYAVFHSLLTAWRLDVDRAADIGLPVTISARFDDNVLVLSVLNRGEADTFSAEVYAVSGFRGDPPLFGRPLRWRANGQGSCEIGRMQTHDLELLTAPHHVTSETHTDVTKPSPLELLTASLEYRQRFSPMLIHAGDVYDTIVVGVKVSATKSDVVKRVPIAIQLIPGPAALTRLVFMDLQLGV